MTRIYLPITPAELIDRRRQGSGVADVVADAGTVVHAVTPALREWYTEGDQDELELAALDDAATVAVGLLADRPQRSVRRVVLAADTEDVGPLPLDGTVVPPPIEDLARSSSMLTAALTWGRIVSLHVDDTDAASDVAAAVARWDDAVAGDEDAGFALDQTLARDLLWYDVTEADDVVAALSTDTTQ